MSRSWFTRAAVAVALTLPAVAVADEVVAPAQRNVVVLHVEGMTCPSGCAARVSRALKGLDGVDEVTTRFPQREFDVRFDPSRVGVPRLLEVVKELGFTPTPRGPAAATLEAHGVKLAGRAAEALRAGGEGTVRVRVTPATAGAEVRLIRITGAGTGPLVVSGGDDTGAREVTFTLLAPKDARPGEQAVIVRVTLAAHDGQPERTLELRVPVTIDCC